MVINNGEGISSPFIGELKMYEFIYNSEGQIMGLMLTKDDLEIAEAEGFLILKAGNQSWEDLPRMLIQTDKAEGE